ncbi:hypothetical protein BKA70DRAFT_1377634 [Coprinopsis sp. MPI-PUGE-AT-0042]|nr:hypothetical protein BKA70DRAFT_1377634 [Coprinopsis sp. MPI-PUGE-AT-0042]
MSSFGSSGNKENQTLCASTLGPLKKRKAAEPSLQRFLFVSARTDPLVHYGRHFGRTVRAFCRIQSLIKLGLSIAVQLDLEEMEEESLPEEELKEYGIYKQLIALSPKLEERPEIYYVGDMGRSSNARSDDTRALKSAVVDWITPCGRVLTDRGYHHQRTAASIREKLRSGELIPTGDHWPVFLFLNHEYHPEDPWRGLLRGPIVVNAYKFVFTSPSCSNSKLHGMTCVLLTYDPFRFALPCHQTAVFSRTDKITDSETFYNSLITFLEDPEEREEVYRLLKWWNR